MTHRVKAGLGIIIFKPTVKTAASQAVERLKKPVVVVVVVVDVVVVVVVFVVVVVVVPNPCFCLLATGCILRNAVNRR